jgi:hypothetical protein
LYAPVFNQSIKQVKDYELYQSKYNINCILEFLFQIKYEILSRTQRIQFIIQLKNTIYLKLKKHDAGNYKKTKNVRLQT